jgi:hypothetical protein
VPAQVRQYKAVPAGKQFSSCQPHFVVCGKGMQQDDGRAVTHQRVEDLSVVAGQAHSSVIMHLFGVGRGGRQQFRFVGHHNPADNVRN